MKTTHARRFTKEPSRAGALHPVFGLLAGTAGILIACIFVYQPVMNGAFIWDDHGNIEDNPLVHASDGLYHFWFTTENVDYWPLTSTTWWLEWRMWGRDTTGYHVDNLMLHIAGATLLWLILRRLNVKGAWVIAAAFAVHPVNVESVAWITERKNTLSMFFCMLSAWLYLRAGACAEPSRGASEALSTESSGKASVTTRTRKRRREKCRRRSR